MKKTREKLASILITTKRELLILNKITNSLLRPSEISLSNEETISE